MTHERIVLEHGQLRFAALAAGEGPVVLLLHGFPDTPLTFGAQIDALAAVGYRAVAPVMRGYSPEAQPEDADYHAVRMAEDVVAWAEQLTGPERVHLVGHDWGANVAYAAAALAPERFASLTAMAVPHPMRFAEAYATSEDQQRRSAYVLEFQSPRFEDTVVADDCRYLVALWKAWSPRWDVPNGLMDAVRSTFAMSGVAAAALAYYRQALDVFSEAGQQSGSLFASPVAVPTLGLCGADDECIPARLYLDAMRDQDFPSGLSCHQVPNAGHFLHAEQPDTVNGLLLDWLARHPPG